MGIFFGYVFVIGIIGGSIVGIAVFLFNIQPKDMSIDWTKPPPGLPYADPDLIEIPHRHPPFRNLRKIACARCIRDAEIEAGLRPRPKFEPPKMYLDGPPPKLGRGIPDDDDGYIIS